MKTSASEGKHDYTVMLRDLENIYNDLKGYASNFKFPEGGVISDWKEKDLEIRQKSFDGYDTIVHEMVNNNRDGGDGISIQGMIMTEYIRQHRASQEQKWAHQQEKFNLRKERWKEVTGFILNRGNRDWRKVQNEFFAKWRAWRYKTEKKIQAGTDWWIGRSEALAENVKSWQEEVATASGKEALKKIFEQLEGKIGKYTKEVNQNAPGKLEFNLNLGNILKEAKDRITVDSIGVLKNSHNSTDTTAGLAEIINFGLTMSLFEKNEKQMEEYSNALSIIQNLKVIDILNGIIEGFNEQLQVANENVYDSVETNLAWYQDDESGVSFASAPFRRDKNGNRWTISVCVESNLTGDKYKTRKFADYAYYVDETVFLEPIKGLEGKKIDFTQATSYANIDADELDVYVDLESEWLNKKIEMVFTKNGLFDEHVTDQFDRLGEKFGKYYGDWVAGEALKDTGFYSKPMFPHGPNMLQTTALVAGVVGGPWAAFAVNTLATGIQVADGSMGWKQGAFQVGISAATSLIAVGAGELGAAIGKASSSVTQAATETASATTQVVTGAASATTKVVTETASKSFIQIATENLTRTAANTLVSGISLEGNGLGYDKKRMKSKRTWLAAGATSGAGILSAGLNLKGFSSALVNGAGSTLSAGITTGDWSESFKTGVISAAGNYLGGLLGKGISQGLGTENAYTKELINNYTTFGMRKLLGSDEKFDMGSISQVDTMNLVVQDMYQSYKAKDKTSKTESDPHEKSSEDSSDKSKDPFAALDQALSGIFVSLGKGLGQTMKDVADVIKNGAVATWQGVSNFGESVENWFSGEKIGSVNAKNIDKIPGTKEYRKEMNDEISKLVKKQMGDKAWSELNEKAKINIAIEIIKASNIDNKNVDNNYDSLHIDNVINKLQDMNENGGVYLNEKKNLCIDMTSSFFVKIKSFFTGNDQEININSISSSNPLDLAYALLHEGTHAVDMSSDWFQNQDLKWTDRAGISEINARVNETRMYQNGPDDLEGFVAIPGTSGSEYSQDPFEKLLTKARQKTLIEELSGMTNVDNFEVVGGYKNYGVKGIIDVMYKRIEYAAKDPEFKPFKDAYKEYNFNAHTSSRNKK